MPRIILVPTPIGNLQDITLRALDVLRNADLVAAEDTRHTGRLLQHLGIAKPLQALHMHNEHSAVPALVARVLRDDLTMAVTTDAGTPGISDPGFLLVREAVRQGVPVECLPGPTALIPALAASGLPCERFVYEGFLPPKKGRQTRLRELAQEARTIVLYESPHKLQRTLADLLEHFGPDRPAVVVRELSKLHETYHRGTLADLQAEFTQTEPRGEIVIVISGNT